MELSNAKKQVELKPGYEMTEVGIIPKDWVVRRLGSICQIFGRIGFRGYAVNDIVEEGQGAISISPSNIKENKIYFNNCTYISWNKYEESPEIKIFNGDILLVKTGSTFGKTAIVKNLTAKATLNPQLVVLKKILIDNTLLSYVIGYNIVQDQINTTIVGGAIPTLSQQQISNFQIPLPPTLAEQRAIASALSDVDALIEALGRLIAKKQAIKQGAMQELLTGRRRLPAFAIASAGKPGLGYKETEVGVIPADWEIKGIEEIADVKSGKRLPLGNNLTDAQTPYPYIRVADMFNGGVSLVDIKYVPEDVFPSIKNYRIFKEDIFISVAGTLGIVGKIPEALDGANLTENADRLTNIKCDRDFLLYLLLSPVIQNTIEAERTLGAQPKLALTRIRKFQIPLPPTLYEQRAIAQTLSDMDAGIEGLQRKLDKYKAIKQGMMQELLTGKTRLI